MSDVAFSNYLYFFVQMLYNNCMLIKIQHTYFNIDAIKHISCYGHGDTMRCVISYPDGDEHQISLTRADLQVLDSLSYCPIWHKDDDDHEQAILEKT